MHHEHPSPLSSETAVDLLTAAATEFGVARQVHRDEQGGEELPYVLMGDYARMLVEWHRAGVIALLASVFQIVETLLCEGDEAAQNLVIIGLLESLQNFARSEAGELDSLRDRLGRESVLWWDEIDDFWAARIPYVGATIDVRRLRTPPPN